MVDELSGEATSMVRELQMNILPLPIPYTPLLSGEAPSVVRELQMNILLDLQRINISYRLVSRPVTHYMVLVKHCYRFLVGLVTPFDRRLMFQNINFVPNVFYIIYLL